jgi:hypothetical protein
MDAHVITFAQIVPATVLENGRTIFPLVAGYGHDVELDCRIRQ